MLIIRRDPDHFWYTDKRVQIICFVMQHSCPNVLWPSCSRARMRTSLLTSLCIRLRNVLDCTPIEFGLSVIFIFFHRLVRCAIMRFVFMRWRKDHMYTGPESFVSHLNLDLTAALGIMCTRGQSLACVLLFLCVQHLGSCVFEARVTGLGGAGSTQQCVVNGAFCGRSVSILRVDSLRARALVLRATRVNTKILACAYHTNHLCLNDNRAAPLAARTKAHTHMHRSQTQQHCFMSKWPASTCTKAHTRLR